MLQLTTSSRQVAPFLVIDTEGRPILDQVALVDESGALLYEAFTPQKSSGANPDRVKPLATILHELADLARDRILVAHNAGHDRDILKVSYESCGLAYPNWQFICTHSLSRELFPHEDSYSLEYLCKLFDLGPELFSSDEAHVAAYDARYTYFLYRKLQCERHRQRLINQPNPFSSTRVDSPFQKFEDAQNIYAAEYTRLQSILIDLQQDPYSQSKGVVVVGDAGTGKTHLMMRLAQDVLKINRVLFIRQPTTVDAVQYHIYSRVLESFIQTADERDHSQLDLLLIRSIRTILKDIPESDLTKLDREILVALQSESLEQLGGDATEVKRARWERIEKRVIEWWAQHHSLAGYRQQILRGILRFCRYSDPKRREVCRRWLSTGELSAEESEQFGLSPWDDRTNREEFSLQALQVFGELSQLDAPLILVFDQLEGLWLDSNRPILLRFGEVLKEIFTHVPNSLVILTLFPDRWQSFQTDFDGSITERVSQYVIQLKRPRPDQLCDILNLRLKTLNASLAEIFTDDDLQDIVERQSIRHALNRANELFAFRIHDVPLPTWTDIEDSYSDLNRDSLAQRVTYLEQQFERLFDLLKASSVSSGDSSINESAKILATLDPSKFLPLSRGSRFQDKLQKFLQSETEALKIRFSKSQIINDDDDLGKLRQICQEFQRIKDFEIGRNLHLGKRKIPVHLVLQDRQGSRCLAFLHATNPISIKARIGNLNQLVINNTKTTFILMRDGQVSPIQTSSTLEELDRFRNARPSPPYKTHFQVIDLGLRIQFELVFRLVMNIINRDLEIPMMDALRLLLQLQPENWIVKLIGRAEDL